MNLTDQELKEIDEKYISDLSLEDAQELQLRAIEDLRVSRARLNMNAENSSCPSGSLLSWWKPERNAGLAELEEESCESWKGMNGVESSTRGKKSSGAKKVGKQEGSEGHGRREELEVTETKYHKV